MKYHHITAALKYPDHYRFIMTRMDKITESAFDDVMTFYAVNPKLKRHNVAAYDKTVWLLFFNHDLNRLIFSGDGVFHWMSDDESDMGGYSVDGRKPDELADVIFEKIGG